MLPVVTGSTEWFDNASTHEAIALGGLGTVFPLAPEEAWNIDTKLDDGRPAYGKVYTTKGTGTWTPNCTTTGVSSTAEYNVTNRAKLCQQYFKLW